MNILFYTITLMPYAGGIARVTDNIAQALSYRGHKCFGLYNADMTDIPTQRKASYTATMTISPQTSLRYTAYQVAKFIIDNQIDVIINQQGALLYNLKLCQRVKKITQIPIITFYHTLPGHLSLELKGLPKIKDRLTWKDHLKALLRPLYHEYLKARAIYICRKGYAISDQYVLLSESYLQLFKHENKITNGEKLTYINNSITFNHILSEKALPQKKNIVLIVSRLEEGQKRISKAIQIWEYIEKKGINDWELLIVGDGPHASYYKQLASQKRLKHIHFKPATINPEPLFHDAAIFMMTSAFEGWPLTLIEASQMGCVPIVYDTFSAVHDIITSGQNGIIIPANNQTLYVEALIKLMHDPTYRMALANGAIKNCQRFTIEKIADQWERTLSQLTKS